MLIKLARIFGIVGGALTLLICLMFIAKCIYELMLPDITALSWESKGWSYGYLIMSIVPTIVAAAGFAGSFLVRKKHILAGVLMIISGVLMFLVGSIFIYNNLYDRLVVIGDEYAIWLSRIPNLSLIAAGVVSLIYKPNNASLKPSGS